MKYIRILCVVVLEQRSGGIDAEHCPSISQSIKSINRSISYIKFIYRTQIYTKPACWLFFSYFRSPLSIFHLHSFFVSLPLSLAFFLSLIFIIIVIIIVIIHFLSVSCHSSRPRLTD